MKLIAAVIKPHKLEDVRQAVSVVGVQGVTTEIYRGAECLVEFVPKTKIEIAVEDEQVLRIRTGERGASAD